MLFTYLLLFLQVSYEDHFESENSHNLIMEYASGVLLLNLLKLQKQATEKMASFIFKQVGSVKMYHYVHPLLQQFIQYSSDYIIP